MFEEGDDGGENHVAVLNISHYTAVHMDTTNSTRIYVISGGILLVILGVGAYITTRSQLGDVADTGSSTVLTIDPTAATQTVGGFTIERVDDFSAPTNIPSLTRAISTSAADLSPEARDLAVRNLEKAAENLQKNPDSYSDWMQLGSMRQILGDFVGAAEAWNYAGVIAPNQSQSFASVGYLYAVSIKDYPSAEANYRRALKNDPRDISTYINLFELYTLFKYKPSSGSAEQVLRDGIAANPKAYDLMVRLARYLAGEGKVSEARQQFEAAAKMAESAGQSSMAREIRAEAAAL